MSNPIQKETEIFNQIRGVLNTVMPILSILPLPGDVKAQISDI